jgi:S-adenosyl-L-methionine hydrolase (adenosine-forming)
MAIITLTTDMGIKDPHLGSVKGFIMSQLPNIQMVDITHQITPFNIAEAAYVVRNCYLDFPPKTIHIIGVDSDSDENKDILLISYKNQYIIARDNGIISLIIEGQPDKIIKLHKKTTGESNFPLKDVMAKAACSLSKNLNEYDLGSYVKDFHTVTTLNPILENEMIRGTVIYIDNYGNAITNIRKSHLERFGPDRPVNIHFSKKHILTSISENYSDVPTGEAVCLFGTSGLFEVAINKGNANQLLGLQLKTIVLIEFM